MMRMRGSKRTAISNEAATEHVCNSCAKWRRNFDVGTGDAAHAKLGSALFVQRIDHAAGVGGGVGALLKRPVDEAIGLAAENLQPRLHRGQRAADERGDVIAGEIAIVRKNAEYLDVAVADARDDGLAVRVALGLSTPSGISRSCGHTRQSSARALSVNGEHVWARYAEQRYALP